MSCYIQELRAERVRAGICLTKDVALSLPDARLLSVLLWLRTKEEVMRFYACVFTNKHSVAGISRLARLSSLLGDQHLLRHDAHHSCSSSTLHSA